MNGFRKNRKFRRDYDRMFRRNPQAANLMLLLCELADDQGQVELGADAEEELARLMVARFEDRYAYQLEGGPRNE